MVCSVQLKRSLIVWEATRSISADMRRYMHGLSFIDKISSPFHRLKKMIFNFPVCSVQREKEEKNHQYISMFVGNNLFF